MTTDAIVAARRATHAFFENSSGWGEPTREALEEWFADGVCQCPDECWVAPAGICPHGLASWWLVLTAMGDHTDLHASTPESRLRHAPNFRDIGGIPTTDGRRTRFGRVFRSGVFDLLDDTDRSVLRAIGLRTAIDLRSADEREARVNALPDSVLQVHQPVADVSAHPTTIMERIARGDTDGLGAEMLVRGNRYFVERQAMNFGTVVRCMLDGGSQPVVVHCTAGKDRTGFAVACALWTLGVDHEVVIDDYLRTNVVMRERHVRTLADAAARGIETRALEEMLVVRREYLDEARAAAIEGFGDVDTFLREGLGVSTEVRDRARNELLVAD
jgi:protein-tyrosine phosphatase